METSSLDSFHQKWSAWVFISDSGLQERRGEPCELAGKPVPLQGELRIERGSQVLRVGRGAQRYSSAHFGLMAVQPLPQQVQGRSWQLELPLCQEHLRQPGQGHLLLSA